MTSLDVSVSVKAIAFKKIFRVVKWINFLMRAYQALCPSLAKPEFMGMASQSLSLSSSSLSS